MTVTDQIIILDRRIKQHEAQYDLGREAAKISALSSNSLIKPIIFLRIKQTIKAKN